MVALADDRIGTYLQSVNGDADMGARAVRDIAAAERIYDGALIALDAANRNAIAGADTANVIFGGVALKGADNSSGAAGDETTDTVEECFIDVVHADGALTSANIGDACYLVDDQTVDDVAAVANNVLCGYIAEVYSGGQIKLRASVNYSRA